MSAAIGFARRVRRRATGDAAQRRSRAARDRSAATLGAERRARSVGVWARGCSRSAPRRNGRRGAVEAGPSWNVAAPSVEVTKRSATTQECSAAVPAEAGGSSPRSLGASPRLSLSEGPCGPSERDVGAEPRPAAQPPRRADPPRSFWRRLRRGGSRWAERGPRRADLRRAARARSARLPARILRSAAFVRQTCRTRRRRRGRWITARRGLRRSACRGADAPSAATAHLEGGQQIA